MVAHRLRPLGGHCYDSLFPTGEWRNWQTRRIQVPVSLTGRGGSTPPSPTTLPWRDGSHAQRLDLALRELLRGLAVELEGRVGGFPRDPCVVAGKDLVRRPVPESKHAASDGVHRRAP